ncbi:HAD family hydrolase [Halomicrococcus gelatinilyticus]|uniref:HAD family hydrolase n=1 Tax=Halomicrococcus gelatinilyticus TaxID=1702103 RepID=UPI002E0F0D12
MRAIFFDLDGTLLDFEQEYADLLADAVEAVGAEATDDAIETYSEAFYDSFAACDPDPIRAGFAATDLDPDPGALADALLAREAEACRTPEEADAVLSRLTDEYALGVLTNGLREWQLEKLRASGIAEHFDAVVASYEAGAHKPDPEPFRLAEERLPADEYAMVGDSDADVAGARDAGWIARRYDGGGFDDLPGALDWQ